MKRALLILGILFIPNFSYAQTPTSYDFVMTGTTSTTYSFLPSQVQCNQTSLPGTPGTINPRYIVWDDPTVSSRYCIHDTGSGQGPLFALPIGAYSAVLHAVATVGTDSLRSAPSNQVSFTRLVSPAARTGVHVRGAQ